MTLYRGTRNKSELLDSYKENYPNDQEFRVKSRFIAKNTLEHTNEFGTRSIQFHDTIIARIYSNNAFELFSGGWKTMTTKNRINDLLPPGLTLIQDKGLWYISISPIDTIVSPWDKSNWTPFSEGITLQLIPGQGWLVINQDTSEHERNEKIIAQIKKYVKLYRKNVKDNSNYIIELFEARQGDCFYCQMVDKETQEPLGDLTSSDHLIMHLDEMYIMFSLIYNAVKDAGYREPMFIIQHGHSDMVPRALTRYFKRKLGIAQ